MSRNVQVLKPKFRIDECLQEIRSCLEIGWSGMGFKTEEFETRWQEYTGLTNVIFQNSASASLHTALAVAQKHFGWHEGDEVLTTPLTFVSTNHAILYCGLKPVFVDVDQFLCLDPEDLQKKITPKTRAVMFVGLGGNAGQLKKISEICSSKGLFLILDAAHMAGTKYFNQDAGVFADATCYSFQAVKNLPTGDSGAISFKDDQLYRLARSFTWLGINKDTYKRSAGAKYLWDYDVEILGYKYNGNAIMAALALVGLRYLDSDNAYRRMLFERYAKNLGSLSSITLIQSAPNCVSSQHLVQIIVNNRDGILNHLNSKGIFPGVHYKSNLLYPMYSQAIEQTPRVTSVHTSLLSLPCHLEMSLDEVDLVAESILEFIGPGH